MTEVDRENLLFQRSEEMARLKEKRDLAALVKIRAGKEGVRRSEREGQLRSEKAGKRDELSELKKRREEKSNAAKVKVPTPPFPKDHLG
jgi:RNA polymerase-associated protein RTF1